MIHAVIVSKNKSIYVKTLHTILALEAVCNHVGLQLDITFTPDDSKSKMELLQKKMKQSDRLLWIEYGVSVDKDTIANSLIKYEGFDALVFPVVKEGIDWDMFKTKSMTECNEPSYQSGLTFDTDVSKKIINKERDLYEVTHTDPFCWVLDCKRVMKKLNDKKKKFIYPSTISEFFSRCIQRNVKIAASVNSHTFNHFTHECVGNIMSIPGLTVT